VLVEHTRFTLTLQFDLTPFGARQLLGLPVLRFEQAMERSVAGQDPGDVAFAGGYADQPHFNREFLVMAGMPPSVALAEPAP